MKSTVRRIRGGIPLSLALIWVLAGCAATGSPAPGHPTGTSLALPTHPSTAEAAPSDCLRRFATSSPAAELAPSAPCPTASVDTSVKAVIGDCWGIRGGAEGVLPCDQRHFGQVFAVTQLDYSLYLYSSESTPRLGVDAEGNFVEVTPSPRLSAEEWVRKEVDELCQERSRGLKLEPPFSQGDVHVASVTPILQPGVPSRPGLPTGSSGSITGLGQGLCLVELDRGDATQAILDVPAAMAADSAAASSSTAG